MKNLDVFDGQADCELLAAESSSEDVVSRIGEEERIARAHSLLRVLLASRMAQPFENTMASAPGKNESGHHTLSRLLSLSSAHSTILFRLPMLAHLPDRPSPFYSFQ